MRTSKTSNGGPTCTCDEKKSGGDHGPPPTPPFGFELVSVDMCYYQHNHNPEQGGEGGGGDAKKTIVTINEYPNTGKACKVGHKKPFGWTQRKIIK